jgi:hypothetical protein
MSTIRPSSLYHYTERKFAEDFVKLGIISFGNSENYDEDHLTVAQRDSEHVKTAIISGDKAKLRTGATYADSVEIKNLISLKFEVRLPRYFLKCMTTARDDRFYTEFKADTCIAIHSPYELLSRLSLALENGQLLGEWQIIGDLAKYRMDDEIPQQEEEQQFFIKGGRFSWQNEYRIVLRPSYNYIPKSRDAREVLHVGPLSDICEIL